MLMFIESIIPTFIAILSLALFTKQTRKLAYATVSLSIFAELVPLEINALALFACTACLAAMLILDLLNAIHLLKMSSLVKTR